MMKPNFCMNVTETLKSKWIWVNLTCNTNLMVHSRTLQHSPCRLVLLLSTQIMTKYCRQRTFITWRKRDERERKWWSCDKNYNQMYDAILLMNKNGTKCGLQNKNSAKVSLHFRWPKWDETKCNNVISSHYYYYFAIFLFPESQFRCCIRSHCADAGDVSSSVPTCAPLLRR